jgi:hypothetical protein
MSHHSFKVCSILRVLTMIALLVVLASSTKVRPVSASGNYITIQSVTVSGYTVTVTGQAIGGKTHYYNECTPPGGGTPVLANVPYNDQINNFLAIVDSQYFNVEVQQTQFANDTYCGQNTTNNVYSFTATIYDNRPGAHTVRIEANPTNNPYNIVSGDGWESYISASTNYTIN